MFRRGPRREWPTAPAPRLHAVTGPRRRNRPPRQVGRCVGRSGGLIAWPSAGPVESVQQAGVAHMLWKVAGDSGEGEEGVHQAIRLLGIQGLQRLTDCATANPLSTSLIAERWSPAADTDPSAVSPEGQALTAGARNDHHARARAECGGVGDSGIAVDCGGGHVEVARGQGMEGSDPGRRRLGVAGADAAGAPSPDRGLSSSGERTSRRTANPRLDGSPRERVGKRRVVDLLQRATQSGERRKPA